MERLKAEVAEPKGVTVAQLALARVARNQAVTTAMVGARVRVEIEENVGAARLSLSDEDVTAIEQIMQGAAGRVDVLRPFSWAMEVWA